MKCVPVVGRRACVAATGPAYFSYVVAGVTAKYSFDEFVAKPGDYFRGLFEHTMREEGRYAAAANLVLAGWLEKENRPAAFIIDLIHGDAERLRDDIRIEGEPISELWELDIISLPSPNIDEVKRTGWPLGVPTEVRDAGRDLMHLAEIQRRQKSMTGRHIVGGEVTLTTITRDGVSQKVVHTWPDMTGKPVRPGKIDWKRLRAA